MVPSTSRRHRKTLSGNNLSIDTTDSSATTDSTISSCELQEEKSLESDVAFASLTFSASRFLTKRDRRDRFKKHYKLGKILGKGGFGTCFSCTHLASGQKRACKLLPKSSAKKENRAILHEFRTLAELDHPNLVKVYELFEDKKYFFIVTDLYEGGDLFDLVETRGPLKEEEVATVIRRLLGCIHYCHDNHLVHRDVKPENVLMQGKDWNNIKLIDFGLARQERPHKPFDSIVGSPFYVSPQTVKGSYNRGCDVWAVGVLAYALLCGQHPFEGPTDAEVLERIVIGWVHFDYEQFDKVSPDCTAFIRYLMTYDEDQRPTAAQALQHPWLQPKPTISKVPSFQDLLLKKDIESALQALQRFQSRDCKLKQATGALIASRFLQQRERIDAVFRALDRDCRGCLTIEDVQVALADHLNVQLTQDDLQEQLWPHVNYTQSGTISYSEFAAIVTLEGPDSQAKSQLVYNHLDANQKGYINAKDLQVGLHLDKDTAELVSAKMIAEVTDQEVILREVFEAAVGKAVIPVEAKQPAATVRATSLSPEGQQLLRHKVAGAA